ncbi:hypothetical protein GGR09_000483 [Bartonella heixiaziensis]
MRLIRTPLKQGSNGVIARVQQERLYRLFAALNMQLQLFG